MPPPESTREENRALIVSTALIAVLAILAYFLSACVVVELFEGTEDGVKGAAEAAHAGHGHNTPWWRTTGGVTAIISAVAAALALLGFGGKRLYDAQHKKDGK